MKVKFQIIIRIYSFISLFLFSQSVRLDTDMTNDSFARLKGGSALSFLIR